LFWDQAELLIHFIGAKFIAIFMSFGSTFSAPSLFSALGIAVLFLLLRRRRKRDVRLGVMFRALFPTWLYRSESSKADFCFFLFNAFAFTILFGWAFLSMEFVNQKTTSALGAFFGVLPKAPLGNFTSTAIMTISSFLAYELGYWAYHYLSHKVPLLWEFHKVHHTAEYLSPMTVFRMHPVDSIAFQQFMAVFIGLTGGAVSYVLGTPMSFFGMNGTNAFLVAFVFVTVHLQHSHIWIAATGPLGCVLMSPAHHQLHHSDNPAHFNKNFGSCLSLFDWMFGTLQMPQRDRERLNFGVGARTVAHHTVIGGLVTPFLIAGQKLARMPRKLQRG
jgi:sterol desaturase/sphingolipid hydroxylase (fatty acid hydroxylase superfamily)